VPHRGKSVFSFVSFQLTEAIQSAHHGSGSSLVTSLGASASSPQTPDRIKRPKRLLLRIAYDVVASLTTPHPSAYGLRRGVFVFHTE
jgi:hypothetical protein